MAEITAKMVADLRELTGAGMMDCKRALVAAEGDREKAIENLRKSGAAKADKKAGRTTEQGKILTVIGNGAAAIAEVLCETDFAAKTDKFVNLVKTIADDTLGLSGDGDKSAEIQAADKQILTDHIGVIGENMQIRRALRWEGAKFGSYLHDGGRVAVLAEVEGDIDDATLNDLCMHIAAFRPRYICKDEVPEAVIAKEKEIAAAADPKLAGKPAAMLDKILAGKINRFFSEVCLVDQPWIREGKTTFAKLCPNVKVKRFVRWEVGEEL